jgi:hypothetical protein
VVLCGAAVNSLSTTISIGSQAGFSTLLNFCTLQRGAVCTGSQVNANPTGITYSWASSDTNIISIPGSIDLPNVTVNGVGVGTANVLGDIEQPSTNCSASVQANAKVTPKILKGGNDITGSTQSAVVGQQIALTGDPAPPSGSTPWAVAGTTVGGFNTAPTNGGSFPADFTQASATFYWATS